MKLLIDANLSPKLARRLCVLFPDSKHVFDVGLAGLTPDANIWNFAKDQGFTILTADADFISLARTHGAPPRVVVLEKCDYRTAEIEAVLRRNAIRISELDSSDRSVLIIRRAD